MKEPRPDNRSSLGAPMIIGGFAEPVQSAADGKFYSTKAALSRSHRASGNPHGIDFIELGNEEMPWVEHTTSEAELRDDVRSAVQDVKEGKLPEVLNLET
ncbi:hypothetical protein [Tardiphaga sp. 367_B4_N1_1]|uniref:hypothetical protein n=1 Tax=Tardiphaga sp. 367_B4_N1_1 TaxID=3240777 RepID=UPI003F2434D1